MLEIHAKNFLLEVHSTAGSLDTARESQTISGITKARYLHSAAPQGTYILALLPPYSATGPAPKPHSKECGRLGLPQEGRRTTGSRGGPSSLLKLPQDGTTHFIQAYGSPPPLA